MLAVMPKKWAKQNIAVIRNPEILAAIKTIAIVLTLDTMHIKLIVFNT